MSRATVTVELSNYGDVILARAGQMRVEHVRRLSLVCTADDRVMSAVLPKHVVERLGLPAADLPALHNGERRARVKNVCVELFGRECPVHAVVGPDGTAAVIGVIALDSLDLIVDCGKNEVVPRDPDGITGEA